MVLAKRIFLFLLTNILVLVTLSIVWSIISNVFGIGGYRTAGGLNYASLMAFSLVWGMGGAFISLAMSRIIAKWSMRVRVINPEQASGPERALVARVYELAQKAGLRKMPEVGIYESPELNAFATGPTKSRSLVAVSTGLLHSMNANEVDGVLAHEVAHVANGDMVTLTLIQGVVNAFVLFLSRVVGFIVGQTVREEQRVWVEMLVSIVLQIALGILGSAVVASFSRWREFRADAGAAQLSGKQNMVAALERLQRVHGVEPDRSALAAFKISSGRSGFLALFSTHPPLEERIARLNSRAV